MGKNLSRSHSPTSMISKILQFPQKMSLEQGTTICSSSPNSFLHYYCIQGAQVFQKFMNQLIFRRKYIYDNPKIRDYLPKTNVIYVQKNEKKLTCQCEPLYYVYITESYDLKMTLSEYLQKNDFSYTQTLNIIEVIIEVMAEYQKKKIKNNPLNFEQIFIQKNDENIKCVIRDPYVRNWKSNIDKSQRMSGDCYKSDVYIFGNFLQQASKRKKETIRLSIKYGQSFIEQKSEKQLKSEKSFHQLIQLMICINNQKRYNWLQLQRYIKSQKNKEKIMIEDTSLKKLDYICKTSPTMESPEKMKIQPNKITIKNNNQSFPNSLFQIDYADLHTIGRHWQKFQGYLLNGVKEGSGKIFLTNKHTFDGVFRFDLAEGPGRVIDSSGQVLLAGTWARNKLLTKF